jgi:hypothetical protein
MRLKQLDLFLKKMRENLCHNQLKEVYLKVPKKLQAYSSDVKSPKRLASTNTHNRASLLILSKTTKEGEFLLRKTLPFVHSITPKW